MAILLSTFLALAEAPHCPELACAEQMRSWRAASMHALVFGLEPPPMPLCARTVG